MRTVKQMVLEMERTRMGTSSFDLPGVIKVGETVQPRQSHSPNNGRRRSVFNDDWFPPHLHPNLRIHLDSRNLDDLRRVNGKDRKNGVSEYEAE